MKTDLGSKYKHVGTLPVGQVLSIIQVFSTKELSEPRKEEQGKAVRVASGSFTILYDRQTASYDWTGLPPSVKHRSVIPFTWKDHKFNAFLGYRSPFGQAFTICYWLHLE